MNIQVYHHHDEFLLSWLARLEGRMIEMANTLDDVLADVKAEATVEGSLIDLVTGLKAQLDAVLAGNLTPAQQDKVDAIFAAVETNKSTVAAAVTANTPAAPATP